MHQQTQLQFLYKDMYAIIFTWLLLTWCLSIFFILTRFSMRYMKLHIKFRITDINLNLTDLLLSAITKMLYI